MAHLWPCPRVPHAPNPQTQLGTLHPKSIAMGTPSTRLYEVPIDCTDEARGGDLRLGKLVAHVTHGCSNIYRRSGHMDVSFECVVCHIFFRRCSNNALHIEESLTTHCSITTPRLSGCHGRVPCMATEELHTHFVAQCLCNAFSECKTFGCVLNLRPLRRWAEWMGLPDPCNLGIGAVVAKLKLP